MNRRSFIYNTALLTASCAVAGNGGAFATAGPLAHRGIQLYMVKEDMERDPAGTLKQLGAMGYTQLESYGSDKGIFWGYTNTEFKKLAADNNLTLISSHHNPCTLADFDKLAAEAAEINMKQLICPWIGPQKSIEPFKRAADDFNKRGSICKKHGLKYGYHPHGYPYQKVQGQLPIDVLLANTDASLVDFQMDVYYAVTEGADPYAYMRKHRGRFTSMHLRDVLKHRLPKSSEEESACDMGTGIINFPKLLAAAKANGAKYFFVEQSRFYHETPLHSAKINAEYLRNLRLS